MVKSVFVRFCVLCLFALLCTLCQPMCHMGAMMCRRNNGYQVHFSKNNRGGEEFVDDMVRQMTFSLLVFMRVWICISRVYARCAQIHASILIKLLNPPSTSAQQTLVLVTGDGNNNEGRVTFPMCAMMAAHKGWNVEVWSWPQSLSGQFRQMQQRFPARI